MEHCASPLSSFKEHTMLQTVTLKPTKPVIATVYVSYSAYHYWALKTRFRYSMARLNLAILAEDKNEAGDYSLSNAQWEDLRLLNEAMGEYARLPINERNEAWSQYQAWLRD